jgi:hypothetical protein
VDRTARRCLQGGHGAGLTGDLRIQSRDRTVDHRVRGAGEDDVRRLGAHLAGSGRTMQVCPPVATNDPSGAHTWTVPCP